MISLINVFLAVVRISLFIFIIGSLHSFLKWAVSESVPIGMLLCALVTAACFLVALAIDGRIVLRRGPRDRRRF